MKFLKKLVRLIPPVDSIIRQRNDLQLKLSTARAKIGELRLANQAVRKKLSIVAGSRRNSLSYLNKASAEGRLVEFDYGYRPKVRNWDDIPHGNKYHRLVSSRDDTYRQWMNKFAKFGRNYRNIMPAGIADDAKPLWGNEWFPPLDGICLYGLIAEIKPRIYLEVGSGSSTKFVRQAITDHNLQTKIISIDPHPRAIIDDLCDEILRTPFEDVSLSRFKQLRPGDIMFVDNSHRSFQNSDVTVFFTEVLPTLQKGIFWGVHDIFLPLDYPETWRERFYNEQYLLMCYLNGGAAGDQIELPVAYLAQNPDMLTEFLASIGEAPWGDRPLSGGAFWMRKG